MQPDLQNSLKRSLGLMPLTSIVIANMIGAGIFTTSGLLMSGLDQPILMLVLWITGGAIALCGALSYGELGAAMPEAGGEYVFLSKLYHPLLGFLSGWVSFIVGFSAPIAASAIGVSEYLSRAFPNLLSWDSFARFFGPSGEEKLLSMGIILAFTLIHLRGIVFGSKVQNLLTGLKVLLLVGLVIAGFVSGNGSKGHFSQGEQYAFDFAGWKTIGISLMWIMFAYSGWNASTYVGSEVRDPSRNLPRSLLLGTGTVMIMYLLINALYVYATPPDVMKGVISIGGLMAGRLFGKAMESLFSVLIAFALFSSLSAFIILGPRVYYSMASQGLFFKSLKKVDPTSQAPSNAILLQSLFSVIMVLSGTFDQILTFMGFSLGIFPILAVMGVFRLRKRNAGYLKMPGYPFTPLIYSLSGLAILLLAYFERPVESTISLIMVMAGIPVYFTFRRQWRQ